MKGIRKSLFVLPFAAMVAIAGCSSDDGSPPMGTTSGKPLTPIATPSTVTKTTTVPPVTETVTQTAPTVTETARPMEPQPTVVPEDCSQTLAGWNNWGPKGTGEDHVAESNKVMSVRVGQHACFDQVTFDIKTTSPVGSHFDYTDTPMSAGSGHSPYPPIAGGAVLQGSVFAPGYDLRETGASHSYGPEYFEGWKALREVRFDVSFEGQTSFYIGVFQDNAFRMRSWQDGDVRKIIIQIAH